MMLRARVLVGLQYLTIVHKINPARRFAVVYHLLSLKNNWRLRVKTFPKKDLKLKVLSIFGHQLTGLRENLSIYLVFFLQGIRPETFIDRLWLYWPSVSKGLSFGRIY